MIGHLTRHAKSRQRTRVISDLTVFMDVQRHRIRQRLQGVEERINNMREETLGGPLIRFDGLSGDTYGSGGSLQGHVLSCAGDEIVVNTRR